VTVTYTARYPILFDALEATHLVEIDIAKFGLLDHLRVEPSFELHHEEQHLIIRTPREKNFSRVQLVQGAANRPDVQ
jgi:hypothetical protein